MKRCPTCNRTYSDLSLNFCLEDGTPLYGRIWYDNGEYHMTSRERTFVVMYAPSDAYNTENATVKITARSVDGTVPSAGFGLMVHCVRTRTNNLEDYALL